MPAIVAPASNYRGFLDPSTGLPFEWGAPEGWSAGYWDDADVPTSGQTLDNFMQQAVAAITGLPTTLVRPRWQPEPPTIPPFTTNWAAVGVRDSTPLGFPHASEIDAGNGFSVQTDTEEFDTLCSFYGPQADNFAVALRLGLMVDQNREAFQLLNMGLIQTTGRRRVPELVKLQWLERVDITFSMRRLVRQTYPVLFFLRAPDAVTTDTGYTSFVPGTLLPGVTPPLPPGEELEVNAIPFQYLGSPLAAAPILRYTFPSAFSFLGNLSGCQCTVPSASTGTGTTIFDLALNGGAPFATMTFAPGHTSATFAGAAQACNGSDVLSIIPRTSDATLALLSGELFGTSVG